MIEKRLKLRGRAGEEKDEVVQQKDVKPTLVDQAKEKLEEMQHQIDERIRAILTSFRPLQQLQQEVRRLNERLEELERKLARRRRYDA